MTDVLGLSIIIPTYMRRDIVTYCVSSLYNNLVYPGDINVIVGVDGDDGTLEAMLDLRLALSTDNPNHGKFDIAVLQGPRLQKKAVAGLGANINQCIAYSHDELFMQMDDDHILTGRLDISPHVYKLLTDPAAGWIRLMGISYHKYIGYLEGEYWRVDWKSPEVYITSDRPHLKHLRFIKHFGLYPVGLSLEGTEEGYCHMCKDRAALNAPGKSNVLVPLQYDERVWQHVGESWQKQGE